MSRILRRPMFRGGPVDSRGTGITSGLDKPKRGLVNEPGGYAGESKSGAEILRDAPGIFGLKFNNPFLKINTPEVRIGKPNFNLGNFGISPSESASAMGKPIITETEEFETEIMPNGDVKFKLNEKGNKIPIPKIDSSNLSVAEKISIAKDAERDQQGKDLVDLGLSEKVSGSSGTNILDERNKKINNKKNKDDKIIDLSDTEGTGGNEEESTELTVKDYVKMLGGDKAKRRDTSDLLAKASAAFLGTGDVKEGFAEFMNQVAASGPGRLEKIEQAAASLDIKDKIASKRADEQLKMLLGRDDYQAMLKLRLSDPSLQSFETNLVDTAKSLGKSYKNMGVIGNTINKKYGSGSFGGEVSDDTNYVEGKYYIQDTGTGEKIVFKIVEGKAEEVHRII